MSLATTIARRYLFAKKSTNAINIISGISAIGVVVATMALIIVLSVFNGFHDLVASLFTTFDPQIEILPAKGKACPADDPLLLRVKELPQVDVATECVEDQALAVYGDKQMMVRVKGVEDNYPYLTDIRSILVGDGDFTLHAADLEYGIPGIRVAIDLGTGVCWKDWLKIYAPQREGQLDMANPEEAFNVDSLMSAGCVFSVKQAKYDKQYILTSITFARNLFFRQGEITSLALRMKRGTDMEKVKEEIRSICGGKYVVKDRFEQQEDTFRIMKIEKIIAYIFLTFILVIACFNIIGSLSMLIIDKKDDVRTLRHLGASDSLIERIFLIEGSLISVVGAVAGTGLGLLLCWIQQEFGIVGMGESSGTFIVDAYPLSVHYSDVAVIFVTVIAVGFLSVYYPVRYLTRRLL
ncbi:MAG: FtsX-like permease family protein [Bacteroidales bacterium]|nr:FtsX-like permease family protein [Bacteroidales bacterium]MCM1146540.1 FtsX-like permease family protein [Bacteroidales bacterium]MCM1205932.1 FtsX-like permease family protein [Bacillota bacterium]MCM1510190.1 FtsX-like permease family protein [Clostridium sp.]